MLCSFQVYGAVVRLYFCILVQTFLTPSCQPTLSSPQPRGERRLLYLLHFSSERGTGNQIKGVWAFLGEEWKTAGYSQLTDKIGAAHWGLSKLLLVLMMVGETGGREGRGRETDCLLGSYEASLVAQLGRNPPEDAGDLGSSPGLGRSTGEGKGYPLQYSGLESPMDCIGHEVTKSQIWLSDFHFHLLGKRS